MQRAFAAGAIIGKMPVAKFVDQRRDQRLDQRLDQRHEPVPERLGCGAPAHGESHDEDEHGAVDPTRTQVVTLLARHAQLRAPELARLLGLTVPAVRRHLDGLVQAGLVEVRDEPQTAPRGRGRPARTYSLTASGREQLGSDYDHLATDALRFIAQLAGREGVRQFATVRAHSMEQRYAQAVQHCSPDKRVPALAHMLTADGYYAHGELSDPSGSVVCQHHCPVRDVAGDFPELCEEETAMFARLLGRPVTRTATIASGAPGCVTHIDRSITSPPALTVPVVTHRQVQENPA